ncbi:MAG TPA: GlxA family transcriptional regulator [Methylocella sp.]|nr:GlxA family transcriptional regulator [Methylocella sp.]
MSNANPFFDPAWFLNPNIGNLITRVRRIGILIFPNVEMIDVCGPLDVFCYADLWTRVRGLANDPGYQSLIIASKPGPVTTMTGFQIVATHGYEDVEKLDTLIIAGGFGVEQACADSKLLGWVKMMAPQVRRIVSICTGAFVLAAAGLLDNRRATTHWMYCEQLAAAYPLLRVEPNLIYLRDGHVYTSGGITSGIDLSLALIEEDLGQEVARVVAGTMVVFLRRPGGQTQFSPFLTGEAKSRHDIRALQAWIIANPTANLDVENLASRVAMSPRNFARLFRSETGMTPAKFVEQARVDAARCKLEQLPLPLENIASMCGFGTAERLRRSFQRVLNVTPQDYRARFQTSLTN